MENELTQALNKKTNNKTIFIFDLDGTLIHTDEVNLFTYKDAINKILKYDLDMKLYHNKRFTRSNLIKLFPKITQEQYENVIKLKDNTYYKYIKNSKLNSMTVSILKKYKRSNTIILSTNSHKKRADLLLNFHGLFNYFDYRFYKENKNIEKDSKFNHVLTNLKIPSSSVIIFENDESEIKLAILSGIPENNIINI